VGTNGLPTDRHWASVPTQELPDIVRALADAYWQRLNEAGLLDLWRRSESAYYLTDGTMGLWKDGVAVQYAGPDAEIDLLQVNHYRSIVDGILSMTTQARAEFQAKAVNDKTRSLMEAPVATGLVSAYWRRTHLEQGTTSDVRKVLLYGEGYQHLRWDVHAGKLMTQEVPGPDGQPVTVKMTGEHGEPVHEGDVVPESVPPWRVVHDLDCKSTTLPWAMVAHRESLWDLVARYPALAPNILAERGQPRWPEDVWQDQWQTAPDDDDMVTVWCVYHLPTDAIPEGRYALVLGSVVLYDGPALLPDEIPVYPLIAARQEGRGWGHSAAWDLLPLQQTLNMSESSLVTMMEAFGMYNILVPDSSGIAPSDLGSGRKFVKCKTGPDGQMVKPEVMNLLDIEPAAFDYPDRQQSKMETLSGMNSVARGEPDSNLKSGAALALVQSLAVQFNSALQSARVFHLEAVASGLLALLKLHMDTPRVAETAGSGANRYLKEVRKDEIEGVDRVELDIVSGVMGQAAGRLQIADNLLEKVPGLTPEQYLQVVNTGRLDPLTRSETAELDLIAQENDELREGRETPVEDFDDHGLHVKEHRALLDIATRRDKRVADVIKAHIVEHANRLAAMDPMTAALTGQSVPPPPPMLPPGASGDGPPPPGGPPAPKGGGSEPKAPAPGLARPMGGPPVPGGPRMPVNPLTDARAPAAPGAPPVPV
jgi:hypothetical protein